MDSMRWPKQPPKPKKPPLTRLQIARRMLTFFFTPIIFGYCLMEVTVFIAEARRDGVVRALPAAAPPGCRGVDQSYSALPRTQPESDPPRPSPAPCARLDSDETGRRSCAGAPTAATRRPAWWPRQSAGRRHCRRRTSTRAWPRARAPRRSGRTPAAIARESSARDARGVARVLRAGRGCWSSWVGCLCDSRLLRSIGPCPRTEAGCRRSSSRFPCASHSSLASRRTSPR